MFFCCLRVAKECFVYYNTQIRKNTYTLEHIGGDIQMKLSKWSKEVRKAMIDEEMNLKQLADKTGYCSTTISMVINGRYGKKNFIKIVTEINHVLKLKELPERPQIPSEDWIKSVRKAMIDRGINQVNQLAALVGYNRDRVSLVINGSYDKAVIEAINQLLDISSEASVINSN